MRPRIAFMRVADDVSDFGEPDMQRHSKAAVSDTRLQRELIAVAGVVDPGCACDHHHRGRARLRILTREENLTCRARPHTRGNFRIFYWLAMPARERSYNFTRGPG